MAQHPAFVDVSEFADWLGEKIDADDQAHAGALLAAASTLVRAAAGRTWVEDGELVDDVPDVVGVVVCQSAERKWRNPAGIVQEQTGPFGSSFGSDAARGVYLTDDEKDQVRSAAGRTGIGTITTTRGNVEIELPSGGVSDPALPAWAGGAQPSNDT